MTRWDDNWPAMRLEAHFGDRVVRCFAQRPASLYALLERAARLYPAATALVCGDERLTWEELRGLSTRLATGLAQRGIEAGDRVALLIGNRTEFVTTLFAAAQLGAISVPLSTREQTPGLAYMLNDCAAAAMVHDAELADRLPLAATVPALRLRVAIGPCAGSEEFGSVLCDGPGPAPATVNEEDVAVIMYTSGTTGNPKGAALTHLGIAHSVMHYAIAMGLGPDDASIAAVPLSHVTGLVALVATMAHCAAKLVIMPAFKAADFLPLAARERMTHTLMVPAMYNLCLLQSDFGRHDLSAWRVGAYGGAPMPVATITGMARANPGLAQLAMFHLPAIVIEHGYLGTGQRAPHGVALRGGFSLRHQGGRRCGLG